MLTKEKRAHNVVITGMKISSFASDAVQFAELCSSEFNIQPTIRSTARLGKVIEGKIQPLLVTLNSSTEVDNLIKRANLLRFSRSPQVRDRIYLNRHMTRAEALAAYNARVFRRSKESNQSNQSSTNSDDLIRLDVPLNIELDSQHPVLPAPAKVLVQGLDPTAQPFRSASPLPLSRDLEIDTSSTAQPPNSGTSNWRSRNGLLPCYLFNARSLNNKLPELHHLLYSSPPSLVCVSETWLSSVPNSFLDPCGSFTVLRCDRSGDVRGGGTCAFIPRSWRCSQVDIDETRIASSGCELVCFDIYLIQYKLRFFVVYRPPCSKFSSESNRSNMTKLTEILFEYVDPRITNFILGILTCHQLIGHLDPCILIISVLRKYFMIVFLVLVLFSL